MGMPVRIEDELYEQAKLASRGECRTIAGLLEFWAKVGTLCARAVALRQENCHFSCSREIVAMTQISVQQTNAFLRAYKKLHNNQKDAVDHVVADVVRDPSSGGAKKGDLTGVYVYRFDCVNQQFLLAYEYDPATRILLLVGSHKNFYRNLKRA